MTGFGEAEGDTEGGRLRVEIRTVNHRYLNVQMRTPEGFEGAQPLVERVLRERFARGHVAVRISFTSEEVEGAVPVNVERARAYRDAFVRLQEELGLEGAPDLALFAGFRDIFQPDRSGEARPEVPGEVLAELVAQAADRVVEMREAEGERLARDLSERLDTMEAELEHIEARAPERLVAERDRMRSQIRALLEDEFSVDEERLAREVAHLAEKWDIHEEIVRFRSHLRMFRDTLEGGSPDGVGKRFNFIAQEILRETNTLGAKANDAVISSRVVALKEEVDRLREQLENVE